MSRTLSLAILTLLRNLAALLADAARVIAHGLDRGHGVRIRHAAIVQKAGTIAPPAGILHPFSAHQLRWHRGCPLVRPSDEVQPMGGGESQYELGPGGT